MSAKERFVENAITGVMYKLDNLEGTTHYGCDLGYTLTEEENMNGCWYMYNSLENVLNDVSDYLEIYMDIASDWKWTTGETVDFFSDPVKAHCLLMMHSYHIVFTQIFDKALGLGLIDNDYWQDKIEVNAEFIEAMRKASREVGISF